MTATVVASVDANPPSEQFQAVSLWTFVHLKTPRFTPEAALDVVRHLMPTADEDPKHLAKRLRKSLLEHGIALKHVNSLDAAARLLGHADWHAANRAQPKTTLKLTPMSTTYVNVIAERREFYLQEGGLLIWIFAHFDGGARRLTQDDVFFNNNRNAFVVTQATRDASVQQGRFMLDCIWAEPTLMGNGDLQRRVVGFDDLTLERESQRAYYFDFDGARDALQEQARERERQRLAEVREKFETWWLDYETSDTPDYRGWAELRRALAAERVELPQYPNHVPRTLLNALYSAKHGRVIGWRFKTFIEVAHRVEPAHRRYLHYFRRALAAYDRADQLRAEDKSGKWALKVKHYKAQMQINDPAYTPDTSDMKLVVLLFPEIFV